MRNHITRPLTALFLFFFSTAITFPIPAGQLGYGMLVGGAHDWEIPRPSKFVEIDYTTIDSYAKSAPESAARNLNTLSDYLTAPARSELAKARSVYAWISSHVKYDMSTYSGRTYSSEVDYATKVLRSRRTVCTGFALLYKHLLKRAGIEVVNIKGYARTNDNEAGQPIQRVDHEWNAVKLDGDWYLLDLAWAQTTARNGEPNDFYFLTEPSAFIANHFPTDPRWQLLSPALSKAQFDQFPKLYDAYFRLGFDRNFPKTGLIRTGDALTLTLRSESDVEFMCSVGRPGNSQLTNIPVTVRQSDDTYQLTTSVPKSGNWTLYLFAKPKSTKRERLKSYEGIASFTVVKG
ncbi:Kyphoscoliosis peptidase [Fibrisoma montanum]|uniref:Kyphoscoliosis peptidase n=1 Tax=Fibrisoma montanum TaxID=2305895 RepID=A0A418M2A2_9BACT|nr:transglutaminase domain-containing protein [Fibrisoma montanum]RIV19841.1 Kyphoscoliosis peptidase [Fibrisoma montanum]